MLTIMEKVDELQKLPFFQAVRSESLARVAAVAREVCYEAGQALYNESQAAQSMFVIIEGEVALTRGGRQFATVACHELAGALAMLSAQQHHEAAVALRPACALVIDEQDFYDTVADDFNLARGVMRALARGATGHG